ncbi:hypothetical protein [Microlunatus antarcticus]|uniref:Uncharacterized protein n=1 Tax=Microlunatus antarcticus TaxID=53388 RepID=A0A7W5JUQ6_9ACTN|nr:hypothetical protein [Microlunatus antarcticus]MBB3326623.1 hypothetical protein [Microlunatus antarcticus]
MVTRRRTALTAGLGVLVVVIGVLVLRAPAAQAEVGWFSYDGPPSQDFLDGLVAWNRTRAAGAVLVMVGLLVLARLLGLVAAARGLAPARLGGRVLVLAALLVVGGLASFVVLGRLDRTEATVSISKFRPGYHQVFATTVWTQQQAAAALVAATGLVLAAVGVGLRKRIRPRA